MEKRSVVKNSTACFLAGFLLIGLGRESAAVTVNYANGSTNSTAYNVGNLEFTTLEMQSLGTGTATQSGIISGGGFLSKTGPGTINLTAANTFSGLFQLRSGAIAISNDAAFGSSNIAVYGGEIRSVSGARTVSNQLSLVNGLIVGRLMTFTGVTYVSNGVTITASNPDGPANGNSTFSEYLWGPGSITIAEGGAGIGTGSIVFGAANTYTGGTTVNSGRLTLSSTGSLVASGSLTVNGGNLVLNNAAQTVGAFSGTGGTITLGSGHALTVTPTAAGSYAGVITGAGSFTKAGTGTLTLSGANTYTGATTINNGTLALGSAAALPNTALTVSANTAGGTAALDLGSNNATVTGLTIGGIAGGNTESASNIVGTGTLTLGGNVTFNNTGNPLGSTISAGLSLGSATRTFTVNDSTTASDDLTVTGVIGGAANVGISKLGAGTLTLSGANTFTGSVTVQAGTLRATSNASALGTGAASVVLNGGHLALANDTALDFGRNVTVSANATLTSDRLTAGEAQTFALGALTIGANTLTVTLGALASSGTAEVTFSGATLTGDTTFSLDANTRLNLATAPIQSGGSYGLTITGSGILGSEGAAGNYTGPTVINGAVFAPTVVANGGVTSSMGASSNAASNLVLNGGEFRYEGGGASNTDRLFTLGTAGGTLSNSGSGSIHFTNAGNVVLSGTNTARTFTLGGTGTTPSTFASALGDNGTGATSLVKTGTGAWEISGANTYTGGTTIQQGRLILGSSTALPNSPLTVSSNVADGSATLDLNGFNATVPSLTLGGSGAGSAGSVANITGPGTLTLGGNITFANTGNPLGSTISSTLNFGDATRTITVTNSSAAPVDLTISGVIEEAAGVGLIKAGTGTLALTGLNTYTGVTAITGGTLAFDTIGNVGGGASSLGAPTTVEAGTIGLAGTTLQYTGSGSTTDRVIDLSGTTASGTLDASGSGALVFTSALTASGAGSKILFLTGTSTELNDFQGAIVDNSASNRTSLTKTGTGTWKLSGANTFTGPVNVRLGTLVVGSATALPTIGVVSVNANTLGGSAALDVNGFDITVNGINLATDVNSGTTGVSNVIGTGTIALTGPLYFVGNGNPLGSSIAPNINLGAASREIRVNDSTTAANDLTISGVISGNTGSGITKTSAGTLLLIGANTYTGTTTVSAGTLALAGSGSIAGDVALAPGATFDTTALSGFSVGSGQTFTSNGTLNAGAGKTVSVSGTLTGSGTVVGNVSVQSGGTISPGNSPGMLATGRQTWNGGGGYVWELNDASDAAAAKGVTYDWLNIAGGLALDSTAGSRFTIHLISLTAANTPGLVPNFVEGENYSYTIASGLDGITGFNPSKFAFDISGFENPITDLAIFRNGNDLILTFTAVPEPSTWALLLAAGFFAAALCRRRAKSRPSSAVPR